MEFSTFLERLPDGVSFPEHLRTRCQYDSVNKRLIYCGFMTKSVYDELVGMHKDHYYRDAVEKLFVQSSDDLAPSRSSVSVVRWTLAGIGVIVLGAATIWAILEIVTFRQSGSRDQQVSNSASQ